MVGVIFLLQSDSHVDRVLIEALKIKYNFKVIELPEITPEELLAMSQDPKRYEQKRDECVLAMENAHKKFKILWTDDFIVYPVYFKEQLEFAANRTYYLPFRLDVPINVRFKQLKHDSIALENYLIADELLNFKFLEGFSQRSINCIKTTDSSPEGLLRCIENSFSHFITRDIRMELDQYFMNIAYVVRKRSNCMKRSVGCVLTRNKRIISLGYNGCPQSLRNCFDGGCDRCNANSKQGEDLHKCFCLHAEESAILECGIQASKDAYLYCTLFPCLWCSKIIVHAKVTKVFYCEDYDSAESKMCLANSGIEVIKIDSSLINVVAFLSSDELAAPNL